MLNLTRLASDAWNKAFNGSASAENVHADGSGDADDSHHASVNESQRTDASSILGVGDIFNDDHEINQGHHDQKYEQDRSLNENRPAGTLLIEMPSISPSSLAVPASMNPDVLRRTRRPTGPVLLPFDGRLSIGTALRQDASSPQSPNHSNNPNTNLPLSAPPARSSSDERSDQRVEPVLESDANSNAAPMPNAVIDTSNQEQSVSVPTRVPLDGNRLELGTALHRRRTEPRMSEEKIEQKNGQNHSQHQLQHQPLPSPDSVSHVGDIIIPLPTHPAASSPVHSPVHQSSSSSAALTSSTFPSSTSRTNLVSHAHRPLAIYPSSQTSTPRHSPARSDIIHQQQSHSQNHHPPRQQHTVLRTPTPVHGSNTSSQSHPHPGRRSGSPSQPPPNATKTIFPTIAQLPNSAISAAYAFTPPPNSNNLPLPSNPSDCLSRFARSSIYEFRPPSCERGRGNDSQRNSDASNHLPNAQMLHPRHRSSNSRGGATRRSFDATQLNPIAATAPSSTVEERVARISGGLSDANLSAQAADNGRVDGNDSVSHAIDDDDANEQDELLSARGEDSPCFDVPVTFCDRNRGTSALFTARLAERFASTRHRSRLVLLPDGLSAPGLPSPQLRRQLQLQASFQRGEDENGQLGEARLNSRQGLSGVAALDLAAEPRGFASFQNDQLSLLTLPLGTETDDNYDGNDLPLYTRVLYVILSLIGVVRLGRGPHQRVICPTFPSLERWAQLSYRVALPLYPLAIFLYSLINVFYLTIAWNSNNLSVNWLQLLAHACTNVAPLTSWVGGFVFIGLGNQGNCKAVFAMLANLESHDKLVVRGYVSLSCLAGIILMAFNIGEVPNIYNVSFLDLANAGLWFLLNYLIIAFVVLGFSSLLCHFHSVSLVLFRQQFFAASMSFKEVLKEHIVLMRLTHQSARYLQWIIGPILLLYLCGALLQAFHMFATNSFTSLSSTALQLLVAFVILMIPLHAGARITSRCKEISRLAVSVDLTDHLVERQALLQQLVQLPENAFHVFSVKITNGLLATVMLVIIAGFIVLARGATGYGQSNN